jgi:hypothetical protein
MRLYTKVSFNATTSTIGEVDRDTSAPLFAPGIAVRDWRYSFFDVLSSRLRKTVGPNRRIADSIIKDASSVASLEHTICSCLRR